MNKREFKDRVYERLSAVPKALANPLRLELLELVAQCERPVEWLADATDQSMANTSQHLQVLRRANLVEQRRSGNHILYRLGSDAVWEAVVAIRRIAHARDAEIERVVQGFFTGDGIPFTADELLERMKGDDLVLLDVRPHEEFVAAHVLGARSVPVDALPSTLADLEPEREIVAYCRGPYCVFADDAVRSLRAAGLRARRLEVGLPEWRAAGLPIATGEA